MDPHPNFKAMYARAAALGLKPVQMLTALILKFSRI